MKILIISDLFEIKKDCTIPSVVGDFAKAFIKSGHDIVVIRPNFLFNSFLRGRKFAKTGKYYSEGITIYNRNFFLPFVFENKKFSSFLKCENFDLIISHMPSGHIYAALINQKLKLKHIAIIHNSDYRVLSEFKYSFYFKNRLKKSLEKAKTGARNRTLAAKTKAAFILPSFIEKENILNEKAKQFDGKKLKIITLSKLIKRKNIDLIIKALSQVSFDFEYSIYGEGSEQKHLEKLIEKYDLKNKIKIYPYYKHDKIYSLLDNYDVFALLSNNETFGLSYLEALARGLIVVGTKDEGIDGIVENNENGYLITPNKEDIIQKLNEIFELKQNEKQELSQKALLRAQNFTREKVMDEYLKNIARM